MKSVYASAAFGLTIGVGPAIAAHLMPRLGMLDQLGAVILGLIIGMQAASRRRTRYDRRGPEEAIASAVNNGIFIAIRWLTFRVAAA